MKYLQDVTFIGTLFSCFVFVIRNHCCKKQYQNKKVLIVNDCKNTRDVKTQTPIENIPYSNFMFEIQPVDTIAIKNNDEHVKYILTILIPEKHDEHTLKAIERNSRWGICQCTFHQVIIVDHHNTRQNTHDLFVIEGDGSKTLSMFDFIMKYSTSWPIQHCGNGDGCRFMIVNGKFFLLGIPLSIDVHTKNSITAVFLNQLKEYGVI